MKIAGESPFLILALASTVCMCSAFFFKKPDDEDKPSLLIKPIKIFSRPDPHADKDTSPGLIPHLGNVFHGGSIGIELTPFGIAHSIIGGAKKVIIGSKDMIGHPSHEEPPEKDNYDERKDWEYQKPKKEPHKEWEEPEEEEPKMHRPEKPVGPSWDEIGEHTDDEDGTDFIQPRVRPKRFIESKIYHVPLLYRSNGRPYQVKIKSRNDFHGTTDADHV